MRHAGNNDMKDEIKNGTIRTIDGKSCIYYDGHWIRHYSMHSDKISDKKTIIDQMTRRVFHHVEVGINTPGHYLDEIRAAYETETCSHKKRVKAAMLAGSLLNRGRDILTAIVNLESAGVKVEKNNPLYSQCGRCLMEALELGENIRLTDGGEGISELWGEPFRVFTMPMQEFFETRYIKLAQTMSEIDRITGAMTEIIRSDDIFHGMEPLLMDFADSAKEACETLRSDPAIFEVWPTYVAAKELFDEFRVVIPNNLEEEERQAAKEKNRLLKEGSELLSRLTNLRVPVPDSVEYFLERSELYFRMHSEQQGQ